MSSNQRDERLRFIRTINLFIRIVTSHFWLWYCTTEWSYYAAGAFLFKIFLLITISYEVRILKWLQHTFTERINHEIRGRACLFPCLQHIRFCRQNDISFCNIVLTLAIVSDTSNKKKNQRDIFHIGNYTL